MKPLSFLLRGPVAQSNENNEEHSESSPSLSSCSLLNHNANQCAVPEEISVSEQEQEQQIVHNKIVLTHGN